MPRTQRQLAQRRQRQRAASAAGDGTCAAHDGCLAQAHVNYHPEKPQRMVDLHGYYYKGDAKGIWKWNGGEGSRLEGECKEARRAAGSHQGTQLVQRVQRAGRAEWGGIRYLEFKAHGKLATPWGEGTWGDATNPPAWPNTIFAEFIGQTHLLKFEPEGGDAFSFMRCSDGERNSGRLVPLDAGP